MKKVLGIDVGGTKIAAGLVDSKFKLSKVKLLATSQTDLALQIIALIESYKDFSAIGLAVPGQVLPNGMVVSLPNIPKFRPTNLRNVLNKRFKVPVTVMNDAKSFAYAEALIGRGKKYQTVAGIILGTGIGVGLVSDKKIYFGANRLAGEYGHIMMPNNQIFEKYVKSAGKFKTAKQAEKYLRLLVGFIVRSFDPELIVVGGGWSRLPGMQLTLNQIITKIHPMKLKTRVSVSRLSHAGILGAALLALKK